MLCIPILTLLVHRVATRYRIRRCHKRKVDLVRGILFGVLGVRMDNAQILVQFLFPRIPVFVEFLIVTITVKSCYVDDISWQVRIFQQSENSHRIFTRERILVSANPALENPSY